MSLMRETKKSQEPPNSEQLVVKVMSRRSSRLVSGGYYNSDEESDSSTVTNISYRENPVKVFKKKLGRKAGSRTSSRANSNASSPSVEDTPVTEGQSDDLSPPSSPQSQPTMRTVPYISSTATPRPPLTPSSSRSATPTCCRSAPVEKTSYSGYTGPYGSSRLGLHLRPNHKELSLSGVDSSGYSSSEGTNRRPTGVASGHSSRMSGSNAAPSPGYGRRISTAFFNMKDSASSMAVAAESKVMTALANASLSRHMKKACVVLLLLLLLLLCVWLLLPLLTSFFSRTSVTKNQTQTKPKIQPVVPVPAPPPPAPQPSIVHHTPVVDPAVVSAAVEANMQRVLVELQRQRDQLFEQVQEQMKQDVQRVKSRLETVNSESRLRLEQEVAGLGRQMEDYQSDSRSSAAALILRIQALEAQNAQLVQELSSIQMLPPPAPSPDPSPAPVQNQLTPELELAMEKWLSDRIKEHDAFRLSDGGSVTDFGRPMADKMADFALETQGASVISTRCSETYRIRSACVTLFGFPLWYPSESPRTVIQGYPVLLPGKCWAFHGVQGTLVISLSHPITITHVTLDHLPRYNSPTGRIDSALKEFEVYGMKNDTEEGTLLGTFTYDEQGEPTQTFKLPSPSDEVYRVVELRVLSNWGHVEYTCLYRFRVHGKMADT